MGFGSKPQSYKWRLRKVPLPENNHDDFPTDTKYKVWAPLIFQFQVANTSSNDQRRGSNYIGEHHV